MALRDTIAAVVHPNLRRGIRAQTAETTCAPTGGAGQAGRASDGFAAPDLTIPASHTIA
jgi:hypothetical protein